MVMESRRNDKGGSPPPPPPPPPPSTFELKLKVTVRNPNDTSHEVKNKCELKKEIKGSAVPQPQRVSINSAGRGVTDGGSDSAEHNSDISRAKPVHKKETRASIASTSPHFGSGTEATSSSSCDAAHMSSPHESLDEYILVDEERHSSLHVAQTQIIEGYVHLSDGQERVESSNSFSCSNHHHEAEVVHKDESAATADLHHQSLQMKKQCSLIDYSTRNEPITTTNSRNYDVVSEPRPGVVRDNTPIPEQALEYSVPPSNSASPSTSQSTGAQSNYQMQNPVPLSSPMVSSALQSNPQTTSRELPAHAPPFVPHPQGPMPIPGSNEFHPAQAADFQSVYYFGYEGLGSSRNIPGTYLQYPSNIPATGYEEELRSQAAALQSARMGYGSYLQYPSNIPATGYEEELRSQAAALQSARMGYGTYLQYPSNIPATSYEEELRSQAAALQSARMGYGLGYEGLGSSPNIPGAFLQYHSNVPAIRYEEELRLQYNQALPPHQGNNSSFGASSRRPSTHQQTPQRPPHSHQQRNP